LCCGPFGDGEPFVVGEIGFGVHAEPGVGGEGHFFFFHGLDDLFEFMVLAGDVAFGEFGEVEVSFAIVDVVGHPPGDGLDVGVPGVVGGVAVAVVAGFIEEEVYVFGYGIFGGEAAGVVAAEVFFGAEELDEDEEGEEGEEEDAEHG